MDTASTKKMYLALLTADQSDESRFTLHWRDAGAVFRRSRRREVDSFAPGVAVASGRLVLSSAQSSKRSISATDHLAAECGASLVDGTATTRITIDRLEGSIKGDARLFMAIVDRTRNERWAVDRSTLGKGK